MQNRRTKQEKRVLAHYALQEGGKALEEGLMQNAEPTHEALEHNKEDCHVALLLAMTTQPHHTNQFHHTNTIRPVAAGLSRARYVSVGGQPCCEDVADR